MIRLFMALLAVFASMPTLAAAPVASAPYVNPAIVKANAAAIAGGNGAIFGLHNATPGNLAHWRKAKADVMAGTVTSSTQPAVCMIGDSTTAGVGANAPQRQNDVPYFTQKRLNAAGVTTNYQNWFGDAGVGLSTYSTSHNTLVTFGTGWSTNSNTLGGKIISSSTATAPISMIAKSVNTVDVYYKAGNAGTFTIDVGGSVLNTTVVSTTAGTTISRAAVSLGATGDYTINLTRTSGALYIVGMVARNNAAQEIEWLNMGFGGSTTVDWTPTTSTNSTPLSAIAGIPNLALCIINLGINDRTDSYGPTPIEGAGGYRANLTAWVTALKAQGTDVLLEVPTPSNITRADATRQATYNQVIKDVSLSLNVPYLDMAEIRTDWVTANSLNYMADVVHDYTRGYADTGFIIARVLQQF